MAASKKVSQSKPEAIFGLPLDTPPMEAKSAAALPSGPEWQYEPKWDGFRCLAFKSGKEVDLRAKSGKPLGRFFPEVVTLLQAIDCGDIVVDGELVIEVSGNLSFEDLQMRLHPAASRIRKLSEVTPARFMLFDMLFEAGAPLLGLPLSQRRARLDAFARKFGIANKLGISPLTLDLETAKKWLAEGGADGTDGVVAKRADRPYEPGERAMIKVKRLRTADCVVGGFRYASDGPLVGSLLLGLYNANGELDHVGFTSMLANGDRAALTRRLEALREPPGFTGKRPGGPSRWSTERSTQWEPLRPELVVEVRFDHVSGDRLRHGTKLMRWRPDKRPSHCTFEQLAKPMANIEAER